MAENTIGYKVELDTAKAQKQLSSLAKQGNTIEQQATGSSKSVANASKGTKSIGSAVQGISKALKAVAKVMVAIKAVTAPIKMALDFSKLGNEIEKTAIKMQMSNKEWQNWTFIADRAGVDMGALQKAIRSYNANAIGGKSFTEAVKEVQAIGDETARNAKANELFGASYSRLLPILQMSNSEMEELIATQELLGGVYSDSVVHASAKMQDSITNLKTAFGGLKAHLAEALLPALKTLVDWLTAIVAAISNVIAKVRAIFGGGGGAVSSAVTATTTIAGNMASASGSASALNKTLMGFDQLNMLQGNSGGGGGGAGGSSASSDSDGSIPSSGEYSGLASKIEVVTDALKKIRDVFIEINEKLHITEGLRSLFETIAKVWNEKLVPALGDLKDALQELWENEAFQFIASNTMSLSFNLLGDVFEYTGKQIASTVKLLADYVSIMSDILNGDWKSAGQHIKAFWKDAADIAVINNWELLGDAFDDVMGGVQKTVEESNGKIESSMSGLYDAVGKQTEKYLNKAESSASHHVSNIQSTVSRTELPMNVDVYTRVAGAGYSDPSKGASALVRWIDDAVSKINPIIHIGSSVNIKVPDMTYSGNRAAKEYADGWNSAHLEMYGEGYYYANYTPVSNLQHLVSAHATGGIIQRPILAGSHLMGEAGREAILPLDNNTEWADIVADKLGGGASTVVLQVDGRQLGYATIKAINGITRTSGRCQLAL